MKYPKKLLILSVIAIAFFGFCHYGISLQPRAWPFQFVFAIFTLISVLSISEICRAEVLVSKEGIFKKSILGNNLFVDWKEVKSVKWISQSQFFLLNTNKGKIKVSVLMNGIITFLNKLEEILPASKVADLKELDLDKFY